MVSIHTERLELIPLNLQQLQLLSESRATLEKSMNLAQSNLVLNAEEDFMNEFESAIQSYILPKLIANPEHFEWYTHWLIVNKALRLTIGGIGITGLPNECGETMMGYFVDASFEGRGIATEAVEGLLRWMFQNEDLKAVIADTLVDGFASQKVLQKNGFSLVGTVEEGLRWKVERPEF